MSKVHLIVMMVVVLTATVTITAGVTDDIARAPYVTDANLAISKAAADDRHAVVYFYSPT
ncbi:MAG: hypothetical protein ABII79_09145 [bacterium]